MARILTVALVFVLMVASAQAQSGPRSGVGPCRQGALALIGMLDDGKDNTADYRHAYQAVVQTCGSAGTARSAPVARSACRDLARKLLDTIEDGKMNTPAFVRVRDAFRVSCAPE